MPMIGRLEDSMVANFDIERMMQHGQIRPVSMNVLPLGLLPGSGATEKQIEAVKRVAIYPFPFVRERIIDKNLIALADLDTAELEFRRYFSLTALVPKGTSLGIPSHIVDEFWHTFLLFTRAYRLFCDETVGRFIHHKPRTSFTPISKDSTKNFVQQYNKFYGEVPEIWARDLKFDDCSTSTASTGNSEWGDNDDD